VAIIGLKQELVERIDRLHKSLDVPSQTKEDVSTTPQASPGERATAPKSDDSCERVNDFRFKTQDNISEECQEDLKYSQHLRMVTSSKATGSSNTDCITASNVSKKAKQ
jgi:hypothetical protein